MRRQIFILFLAFSLLLSACGSEGGAASSSSASSPPAEDHSVGGSPAPEEFAAPLTLAAYPTASFHPVLSGNKANLTLAPLLYEGLFAVDSQFQAVPLLCEGYTVSEDRLTWTFTLRSGVTFSDGTPLTGETAAQALQTALDPASRYAGHSFHPQRGAAGSAGHPHCSGDRGAPAWHRPLSAHRQRWKPQPHRPLRLVAGLRLPPGPGDPPGFAHQIGRAGLRLQFRRGQPDRCGSDRKQ